MYISFNLSLKSDFGKFGFVQNEVMEELRYLNRRLWGRKFSEDPRLRTMAMEDIVLVTWKMLILCELSTDKMESSEDIGFSTYLSIYLAEKSFEDRIRGDGEKI